MKAFKVNQYITLRLEGGRTIIYVKDEPFRQCKFLLIDIPIKKIELLNEIESIDEAAEKLDQAPEHITPDNKQLPLEDEFWGHCSNLQVWAENNYNTRLLHCNLAFPLLRKLINIGDPKADIVFKEEIAKRIESGYLPTIRFILENHYLDNFSEDEIHNILLKLDGNIKCIIIQFFEENPYRFNSLEKYYDESYEDYKCFRGAYNSLKEANTLSSFEKAIKIPVSNYHKFKLIKEFEYDPSSMEHFGWDSYEKWFRKGKALFKIKSNHVAGIYIHDPGNCDACFDKDNAYPPRT